MTSPPYWGGQATAERLALAVVVSAGAHLALLANAPFAPGAGELALFAIGQPLTARLAPAPEPRPEPVATAPAARVQAPAKAAGLPSAEIYFRSSEVDERARPLNEVNLAYPERALASGLSGVVTLRLKIDHQGVLRDAAVVDARPAGVFESAALEAVLGLKFRPAIRKGVAVGSVKTIEVPFDPDCKRTGSCIE